MSSDQAIGKIGESAEMVRRYAHLGADHLAPYAERLGVLRAVEKEIDGTKTAQARKKKGLASLQALDLMVAGEGFEPSTFGL